MPNTKKSRKGHKKDAMPFSFLNIKGYIGNGAFWITCDGIGFLIKDTSINQLTIKELGSGGKFLGSLFFRVIKWKE